MTRSILVTGGTIFVSRFIAKHFVEQGDDVTVLNRGSHPPVAGVRTLVADRHDLGHLLDGERFDAVIDVTAYDARDVLDLAHALEHARVGSTIMISSSAVYPETNLQPFAEGVRLGRNMFWGDYGTGKIEAERALLQCVDGAYIVRPPYLYGPMNNLYREAFVFDCAREDRRFYLPHDGDMRLQFFHVRDLCRFLERIIDEQPTQHVFNVGNPDSVTVREWVDLCYAAVGKTPTYASVDDVEPRNFFPFHDYEYSLDVHAQQEIMPDVTPLDKGLCESYDWYRAHVDQVNTHPYTQYIDLHLAPTAQELQPVH